jgi:hypothetical protein
VSGHAGPLLPSRAVAGRVATLGMVLWRHLGQPQGSAPMWLCELNKGQEARSLGDSSRQGGGSAAHLEEEAERAVARVQDGAQDVADQLSVLLCSGTSYGSGMWYLLLLYYGFSKEKY